VTTEDSKLHVFFLYEKKIIDKGVVLLERKKEMILCSNIFIILSC